MDTMTVAEARRTLEAAGYTVRPRRDDPFVNQSRTRPEKLSEFHQHLVDTVREHGAWGVTVSDLCSGYPEIRLNTASKEMTRLGRWGFVKTVGRAKSFTTNVTGNLWAAV